jgi:non-homologous end joining protein Ku
MYYTDDPIADFDRYDKEQQERLEQRPVCSVCGEHIQDDH